MYSQTETEYIICYNIPSLTHAIDFFHYFVPHFDPEMTNKIMQNPGVHSLRFVFDGDVW